VTASGTTAYLIDGVANQSLTLTGGKTYAFNLNVAGHPFDIKTAPVREPGIDTPTA